MRVQMTTHITGARNGVPWPVPPGTIDLPDDEAADLISLGHARPTIEGAPTDETITAAIEPDGDPAGHGPDATPDQGTQPPSDTDPDTDPATQLVDLITNGATIEELTALADLIGVDVADDDTPGTVTENLTIALRPQKPALNDKTEEWVDYARHPLIAVTIEDDAQRKDIIVAVEAAED